MAIELCPENTTGSGSNSRGISPGMSPRISFSHEFGGNTIPIEPHIPSLHPSLLLDSAIAAAAADFDFCVRKSISNDQESSSADELFSNGIIRPSIQVKKQNIFPSADHQKYDKKSKPSSSSLVLPPLPPQLAAEDQGLIKADVKISDANIGVESSNNNDQDEEPRQGCSNSKSFWGFKRSRSLNCGSLCKRGLCPLPLLSRSKSTGSTSSSSKKSLILSNKEEQHHQRRKDQNSYYLKKDQSNSSSSVSGFKFSDPFSSSKMAMYNNNQHQKPPLLKKNHHQQGSVVFNNSGVLHVNPTLNMPSADVFGFGSIFSIGKTKNAKKKCVN